MSEEKTEAPPQTNDKELNFRKQAQMYERQLEQAQSQRQELERQLQELKASQHRATDDDDDDDDQPYVEPKTFKKKLDKFGQSTKSEIQKAMEIAKQKAKEELKQELWIEQNPDFYSVLEANVDKFAQKAPRLAESILRMPDTFERQKLVYENIKQLGIDKPEVKQSGIQDKVDANRRNPYYQPSGVGTAPYGTSMVGGKDYSPVDQKNAYQKMQELKSKLRM